MRTVQTLVGRPLISVDDHDGLTWGFANHGALAYRMALCAYIYIPSGYVRKLLKMAIDIVDLLYLFNMVFFQQERCGTMRVFNHHNMIKHWGPAHPVPTAVVPRRVNMGWARLESIHTLMLRKTMFSMIF